MKILVTDPLTEEGIEILREAGEVEVATDLTPKQLKEKIRDIDAIVVRSGTEVTKEVIEAAGNLRVIGRAGVGVDNISVDAATEKGIIVVNAPDAGSISVAEHTFGLILALMRKIPEATYSVKEGKWEKSKFLGEELYDKTIGIIGLGRIGSQVAKRAKAFGMNILACDPYIPQETAEKQGIELSDLETLLENADVVAVHVPLTEETKGLIGKKELGHMKKTAFLINTARGGVVDEQALYEALKDNEIAGAALDVFEEEPPKDNPLLQQDNVVFTPHLGGSTREAQKAAAVVVAREVVRALQNKPIENVVNLPVVEPGIMIKLRPFMPLIEKLGTFAVQAVAGRLKKVNITYCGKIAEIGNLNLLTHFVLKGILAPVFTGSVSVVNAPLVAKNRGIKVVEAKTAEADDFENLINLKITTEQTHINLTGTLLGGKEEKIVEIDGYRVDITPEGKLLLVKHADRPGMIGRVATTLGNHNVNIAALQSGRKKLGGIMLTVLRVDQDIPPKATEEFYATEGIEKVTLIRL